MRLFVALEIENQLKDKILEVQKSFSGLGEIKFVERENFHLTLKFLGEIQEGRSRFPNQLDMNLLQSSHNSVNKISERIKYAIEKLQPFEISLEGLSFFGSPNFVKVIFLEVGKGKENIINLENELNEKLREFKEEDFDPHPHLTIGRVGFVKEREKLLGKINSLKNVSIGEMEVKEIILMKSELKGIGPVYSVVERFKLK